MEILDYATLRSAFGTLLAEIQRIKSEGDLMAAQQLVEQYGVRIDDALHREILERYHRLHLAPYKGFINPTIVPVEENGKITDYKIVYGTDFLGQMMEYGEKYSFE